MKDIEASTGDENLILAEIDASVGYGVFAGKDYQPGSYICRYGGRLSAEGAPCTPLLSLSQMNCATSGLATNLSPLLSRAGTIKNRAYAVVSGVEGMVLDGTHYRNLGGAFSPSPYRLTTARWPSFHTQRPYR
jgi:hypothetical protein